MELFIREQDREKELMSQLYQMLYGLHTQEVRLGCKKTRGYGELKITSVRIKEYTAENILEYKDAYDIKEAIKQLPDCKEKCFEEAYNLSHYVHIEVPLKMRGGISIRQYFAQKDEPDFAHITANTFPVIPGTSFAGAIRSRMRQMLCEIFFQKSQNEIDSIMDYLFGYVKEKKAHCSNIVIKESVINSAKSLTIARTAVSRFESSAKSKSYRKEKTYVDGTLTLKIDISKKIYTDWIVGLLLLVIKDIQNGYLPVGGQTAIGRGIFEADGDITIDGKKIEEKSYFDGFLEKIENPNKIDAEDKWCFEHYLANRKKADMLDQTQIPKKGTVYAVFTNKIVYGKYYVNNVGMCVLENGDLLEIQSSMESGKLLELHLFDHEKEYRCVKTRRHEYRSKLIDDKTSHDDSYTEEIYVIGNNTDQSDDYKKKVGLVNYICYNDDDLLTISNYRLKEVE